MRYWVRRIFGVIVLIFLIKVSSDHQEIEAIYANSKIYRIAILPICNLGMVCDAALPKKLEHLFFKHRHGIASYMHEASNGYAIIKGKSTAWLRPKNRLKSQQEVFTATGDLIALAKDQINFNQFDVFIFYTELAGAESIVSWPPGQIVKSDTFELLPGLAFVFNAKVFDAINKYRKTAILPGIHWAQALLDVLNLTPNLKNYACNGQLQINACRLTPTLDFLLDERRSLAFDWSINGQQNWHQPSRLQFINQNGLYKIGERDKMARTLEISLPKVVHFPNNMTKFDRLLIEFKTQSRWDRLADLLDKNNFKSKQAILMSQVDIFLKGGSVNDPSLAMITLHNQERPLCFLSTKADGQFLSNPIKIFNTNISMEIARVTDSSLTIKIKGYP